MDDKKHARIRTVSVADLRKICDQLDGFRTSINSLAATMDQEKLESVDVDGGGQGRRAVDLMFKFISATRKAIDMAQWESRK